MSIEQVQVSSLRFAQLARDIGNRARGIGLDVPGFRSPPRSIEGPRAIRRNRDGSCDVAVAIRGREWVPVAVDMIDGVLEANGAGLRSGNPSRAAWRAELYEAVDLAAGPDEADEPTGAEVGY